MALLQPGGIHPKGNKNSKIIVLKQVIFGFAVIIAQGVLAQVHLGFTEAEIRNKYPNNRYEVRSSPDGVLKTLAFYNESSSFLYLLNKEGVIHTVYNIFIDMAPINGMVEFYNNHYVVVSEVEWKAYLEKGQIMRIVLKSTKDGLPFFEYSMIYPKIDGSQ